MTCAAGDAVTAGLHASTVVLLPEAVQQYKRTLLSETSFDGAIANRKNDAHRDQPLVCGRHSANSRAERTVVS